jgi:hypothetical protein
MTPGQVTPVAARDIRGAMFGGDGSKSRRNWKAKVKYSGRFPVFFVGFVDQIQAGIPSILSPGF